MGGIKAPLTADISAPQPRADNRPPLTNQERGVSGRVVVCPAILRRASARGWVGGTPAEPAPASEASQAHTGQ